MVNLSDSENKGNLVREMFDAIAFRYDRMNTFMSLGQDKFWRRFAVEWSGLKIGGFGLDICCGTGMLTKELARVAGRSGRVIGLDFSANMLVIAKRNLQRFEHKENIELIQGNAMQLPFESGTFDCVTVGWGLRNVSDISKTVQEMTRVVKPGGKVVSIDMGQPDALGFRELYWLCFKKIIPVMGGIGVGNKRAYEYLYQSSRSFIHPRELLQIFNQAGLKETAMHHRFNGAITAIEGRK